VGVVAILFFFLFFCLIFDSNARAFFFRYIAFIMNVSLIAPEKKRRTGEKKKKKEGNSSIGKKFRTKTRTLSLGFHKLTTTFQYFLCV
jgi:hypothetical protein